MFKGSKVHSMQSIISYYRETQNTAGEMQFNNGKLRINWYFCSTFNSIPIHEFQYVICYWVINEMAAQRNEVDTFFRVHSNMHFNFHIENGAAAAAEYSKCTILICLNICLSIMQEFICTYTTKTPSAIASGLQHSLISFKK